MAVTVKWQSSFRSLMRARTASLPTPDGPDNTNNRLLDCAEFLSSSCEPISTMDMLELPNSDEAHHRAHSTSGDRESPCLVVALSEVFEAFFFFAFASKTLHTFCQLSAEERGCH